MFDNEANARVYAAKVSVAHAGGDAAPDPTANGITETGYIAKVANVNVKYLHHITENPTDLVSSATVTSAPSRLVGEILCLTLPVGDNDLMVNCDATVEAGVDNDTVALSGSFNGNALRLEPYKVSALEAYVAAKPSALRSAQSTSYPMAWPTDATPFFLNAVKLLPSSATLAADVVCAVEMLALAKARFVNDASLQARSRRGGWET